MSDYAPRRMFAELLDAALSKAFREHDHHEVIRLLLLEPQTTVPLEALKWLYNEWRRAVDLIEKHDRAPADGCRPILGGDGE